MSATEHTPAPMPAALGLLLGHPVGCGGLMALMFSLQLWLPQLSFVTARPGLALIVVLLCMTLNFITPALAAVAALGGGVLFAVQSAAVATLLVFLLPDSNPALLAVFAIGYVLVPAVAANGLLSAEGMRRSSDVLLVVLAAIATIGMIILTQQHPEGVQHWLLQLLAPLFEQLQRGPNAIPPEAAQGVKALLGWTLPGMFLLSLWLMWGVNLAIARTFGRHYGFYQGDPRSTLEYQPSLWSAWAFLISLAMANLFSGDMQYLGVTLALLLGGVMAVNGISVVHLWLRSRGLLPVIVMMYVMLMFWTMIIFPFMILGLIDVWKNFRASIQPANE